MLKFVRKELISLVAELALMLTVLMQLASEIMLPGWLRDMLISWNGVLSSAWQPIFRYLGVHLHPQYASALSLAVLLIILGVAARIARSQTRAPLAPLEWRFLNDMSFASLLIYAGLIYAFLIGSGPAPANSSAIALYDSELAGRYACAMLVTAGYIVADLIGHKAFHRRFIRAGIGVIAILFGLNFATTPTG